MAAARYRSRLLRGARLAAQRTHPARPGRPARTLALRVELGADEVAGLLGDDGKIEHCSVLSWVGSQ